MNEDLSLSGDENLRTESGAIQAESSCNVEVCGWARDVALLNANFCFRLCFGKSLTTMTEPGVQSCNKRS